VTRTRGESSSTAKLHPAVHQHERGRERHGSDGDLLGRAVIEGTPVRGVGLKQALIHPQWMGKRADRRVRGRKKRFRGASPNINTLLTGPLECSRFPMPDPSYMFYSPSKPSQTPLKSRRGSSTTEGALTTRYFLQTGLYTHLCQAGRTSGNGPGALTPPTHIPLSVS
jgi:hypothetical protein